MLLPAAVILVLDLLSIFTGWLFYMQGGLHYQETPLFALQGAANYFYLLCAEGSAIAGAVRAKSRQERLEYGLYSVYLVVPCITFFVDDQAVDSLQLSLTIFLALLILYLTIYVDRENELLRQREQLTQSRVAVMNSQIQPHFLYKHIADLSHTLQDVGAENAFVKARNSFAVSRSEVDCDYYRFLNAEVAAVNTYHGEYMAQYSWAEMTLGSLERKQDRT